MLAQDWIVTDAGECERRPTQREWDLLRERYYLHQFLTEILEILEQAPSEAEEWDFLPQIRMRVRQLITNSYWVQTRYQDPHPMTGVSVTLLYDEIGYPLTVETVATRAGVRSPIHNHGTWGVVAVLKGQERHRFWRRLPTADLPDQIEPAGEKILQAGEIISFSPGAIHAVEAMPPGPTVTFNLYGDSQPKARFQFDPDTHQAKPF